MYSHNQNFLDCPELQSRKDSESGEANHVSFHISLTSEVFYYLSPVVVVSVTNLSIISSTCTAEYVSARCFVRLDVLCVSFSADAAIEDYRNVFSSYTS